MVIISKAENTNTYPNDITISLRYISGIKIVNKYKMRRWAAAIKTVSLIDRSRLAKTRDRVSQATLVKIAWLLKFPMRISERMIANNRIPIIK